MEKPISDAGIVEKRLNWKLLGIFATSVWCLTVGIIMLGYSGIIKPKKAKPTVLSLEVKVVTPTIDPLFENILQAKTSDHYPPNDLYPQNLKPLYGDGIDISARAYAVFDRDTRQLLYGRSVTDRLPIASVAKIMTSVITMENAPEGAEFTVNPLAATIGEASMGLTLGERLSSGELLYGALLPSGNDAAETLAAGVGKYVLGKIKSVVTEEEGRNWFIHEMNKKARGLGMMDTYFFNPTGLDGDTREKTSFSSALDLVALTNYALTNPLFAKIVDTRSIHIPQKDNFHQEYYLYNILQLSDSFSGIKGVKPGNSIFAGETLASYAEHGGRRIILIMLGSDYTKDDALKVYKKIFPA